jgi:Heparinase II/III-like protein/Heparinase II/III N-terminus
VRIGYVQCLATPDPLFLHVQRLRLSNLCIRRRGASVGLRRNVIRYDWKICRGDLEVTKGVQAGGVVAKSRREAAVHGMDWKHKWSRFCEASWQELGFRARQEFIKRWDSIVYPRLPHRQLGRAESARRRGRFFFGPEDVSRIAAAIWERSPDAAQQVVHSAKKICRHRFDLLGYQDLDFGDPINWHLDPISGKSAPRQPFYRINFLDFHEAGDVKITWELNRHQHLVTLARAYCFTGDRGFVDELVGQWYSWRRENPYPIGVNWASSLEVAFRCLSWLWIRDLIGNCRFVPAQFWSDLDGGLLLGGRHIERYLSTSFSPNTHLLGEGVALFFLGLLCNHGRAADRWKVRGWDTVIAEAERQVLSDGMHFEQSTYYHVYALDFLLHARILAQRNGLDIPPSLDATLQRMLQALAIMSAVGVPPRFGDDDGGRVFDPRRNRPENLTDPLSTGSVLYKRADLKPVGGEFVEESFWLLEPEAAEEFDSLENTVSEPRAAALPSSGLYLMPHPGPCPGLLTVDAGPQGTQGAGHGHADALSIQLSMGGEDLLTDAGTFVYVGPGIERSWFRGTSAHNTLTVEGEDQAQGAGPFRWRLLPEVRLEKWIDTDFFGLLIASHTGYQRLAAPVVHRRRVFQLKGEFWVVLDSVEGSGTHDFDVYWHLAPGVECHRKQYVALVKSSKGSIAIVTTEQLSSSLSVEPTWYSPVYGQRMQAQALRLHRRCAAPAEFVTVLDPGVTHRDVGSFLRAEESEQGVSVYRYHRGNREHLLIFRSAGADWNWRNLASDAEFLYYGAGPENRELLIATGLSYVSLEGKHLIDCTRRVERIEVSGGAGARVCCSDSAAVKSVSLMGTAVLDGISKQPGQRS